MFVADEPGRALDLKDVGGFQPDSRVHSPVDRLHR